MMGRIAVKIKRYSNARYLPLTIAGVVQNSCVRVVRFRDWEMCGGEKKAFNSVVPYLSEPAGNSGSIVL